jgi:excisionase family DNA binding protein
MDNRPIAMKVEPACKATGLGKSSLYELMASGALPYVKIGASRLIMYDDLEKLIRSHRVAEAA